MRRETSNVESAIRHEIQGVPQTSASSLGDESFSSQIQSFARCRSPSLSAPNAPEARRPCSALQDVSLHDAIAIQTRARTERVDREAGAIILKITYGYTIEAGKADPLVDLADKALDQLTRAFVPGAWLVDYIPICEFIRTTVIGVRGWADNNSAIRTAVATRGWFQEDR